MEHHKEKLDSLQGLRAIAALLVVIYHASIASDGILNYQFLGNFFHFGYSGVDLFFILSGFIIFYTHFKDIGQTGKLKPFAIKRFTRIYPIYWAVNLFIIPLYFLLPQFGQGYETQLPAIVSSLLLIPQSHMPIVPVAWTLIHEMRFYIIFGLIILLGIKKSLPFIILLSLFSLLQIFQPLLPLPYFSNFFTDFLFSPYNIEFLLGCMSAYVVQKYRLAFRQVILLIGAVIFAIGTYLPDQDSTHSNIIFRLLAYGASSFIIVTSLSSLDINNRIRIPRFFICLGDASYSIYLTHQMIIAAFMRSLLIFKLDPFLLTTMSFLIAVVGGCLIHTFIEKPLIFYSRSLLMKIFKTRVQVIQPSLRKKEIY